MNYRDLIKENSIIICGSPNSGKSVLINNLIIQIIQEPTNKLILIDPKRVDLIKFKNLKNTLHYVQEQRGIITALDKAIETMETRYKIMSFKRLEKYGHDPIYIIIDEMADLLLINRKEVKPRLQRILQLGRASNIHLIVATQNIISKVIDTEIKALFDCTIGLRVRTKRDSINVLGFSLLETFPKYGKAYILSARFNEICNIQMLNDDSINEEIRKHRKKKFIIF